MRGHRLILENGLIWIYLFKIDDSISNKIYDKENIANSKKLFKMRLICFVDIKFLFHKTPKIHLF